jgi:hypothetical protein
MPKLTSFYDEIPPAGGREWKILQVPKNPYREANSYSAYSGNRSVLVNQDRFGFIADLHSTLSSPDVTIYRFNLPIQKGELKVSIKPKDQTLYICTPESVSVKLAIARIEVSIAGVGQATFRPVWRDSDVAKKVVGFVDSECEDSQNEESLVWFAGLLGMFGLPQFAWPD